MHAPKVLYVVADGGRARRIERSEAGVFRTIREVESEHIHDPSRTLGRRPPARVQESAAAARHVIEPHDDLRTKTERAFIARVAEQVNSDRSLDYDVLVIAAPRRLIGYFRKSLTAGMLKKLRVSITKE